MRTLSTIVIMALAACTLGVNTSLSAAPLAFEFRGTVKRVDSALTEQFQLGQDVSGSFTFDSDATDGSQVSTEASFFDQFQASATGVYPYAGFRFSIGEYRGVAPSGSILVVDAPAPSGGPYGQYRYDIYRVQNRRFEMPFAAADVNGLTPMEASFQLSDATMTAFNSDALPLSPPDLSDFVYASLFRLTFTNGDDHFSVISSLSSLSETGYNETPNAVPVPAAITMFMAALFPLYRIRRGRN